jgi:undecaprenyl phosphate-alpha-L-ara4N flippase subunit ArnE
MCLNMPETKLKRSALVVLLISVICNAIGQLLFKYARIAHPGASLIILFTHFEIWLAILLYGFSAISWLWTLSRTPLSYAYPILALSFPIVVGLSTVFFAESISPVHWTGVAVIVLGVAMLART